MKTYTFYFLSLFMALFMACNRADDGGDAVGTDTTPQVTLSSKMEGATVQAGRSLTVEAEISHNNDLKSVIIKTPWAAEIDAGDVSGKQNFTLNLLVNIPENLDPGVHEFFIVATDVLGKATQTPFSVQVEEFTEDPKSLTITVNVPENTPQDENLYLMGDFNNMNPADENYRFTKTTNGSYEFSSSFEGVTTISFSITRGSEQTIEVGQDGNPKLHVYNFTEGEGTITVNVMAWQDLANGGNDGNVDDNPDGNDDGEENNQDLNGETVTFTVTVPENTPADAQIYFVGDFTGHNPAHPDYQLTNNGDGTYSGIITKTSTMNNTITFNFTRGDNFTYDKNADGTGIQHTHTFGAGNDMVNITIARWSDHLALQ